MQRLIIQAPALFIFFLYASLLHAENTAPLPRVSIIPFINEKQLEEYEILCATATETIELTLQLIGSYDVIPPIAADPYTNPEILLEYSDEKKLDYAIFGKAYPNKAGQMVFQASVYDTVQGKVTLTEERTAESILDTFDTADELVVRLMETFSGIHIGFGRIEFINNGLDGDYQVFIDGKSAGENSTFLDKVLNGRREIEIRQERYPGIETIYSAILEIVEEETYSVPFSIPALTAREEEELSRLRKFIDTNRPYKEQSPAVTAHFEELAALIESLPASEVNSTLAAAFRQSEAEWRLKREYWAIEEAAPRPSVDLIPAAEELHANAARYTHSAPILQAANRNAQTLADLLVLKAAYSFSYGKWAEGLAYYDRLDELAGTIPGNDLFGYGEEAEYFRNVFSRYRYLSENKQSLTLPFILGGAGLGFTGTGVGLLIANPAAGMVSEADTLYEEYTAASEPAEAESLHRQIESLYTGANALEYVKWGSIVAGPALSAVSGILFYSRIGAESRYIRDQFEYRLKRRMETARALFDGYASGGNEKRALLIVTGSADAALNADGVPQGAAPVLITDIGPGENGIYISAMPTGSYKTISTKHILHEGLNILHVAVPEQDLPAAEIVSVNQSGRHRYKISVAPVKDADRYVLHIEAAPGGPYPEFEELSSSKPQFTWTDPGGGNISYKIRAAAFREQRNSYAGKAADWSTPVTAGGKAEEESGQITAPGTEVRAKNAVELDISSWTAVMAAPFLFNQGYGNVVGVRAGYERLFGRGLLGLHGMLEWNEYNSINVDSYEIFRATIEMPWYMFQKGYKGVFLAPGIHATVYSTHTQITFNPGFSLGAGFKKNIRRVSITNPGKAAFSIGGFARVYYSFIPKPEGMALFILYGGAFDYLAFDAGMSLGVAF